MSMTCLPSLIRNRKLWFALCGIALAGLGALAFLGWQHFYPVQVAAGWSFKVYRDDIPSVSAMVIDQQGTLFVSQEFKNGLGSVFKLLPNGDRQDVMTNLSKPDGLVLFQGGIAISQEMGETGVFSWRDGRTDPLFTGNNIEGLASDGRDLFAIEDVKHGGRLLQYAQGNKETTALRDDLEEGEGIAVCPDGRLFYTEKKKGWIKNLRPGRDDDVVARGLHDPSFLMCNGAGLWITEDLTHRARLLLLDASGTTHTILSHLRAPQTIIALAPGRYLVAEQGRGRILELDHSSDEKQ
jgi:hypothetical protein